MCCLKHVQEKKSGTFQTLVKVTHHNHRRPVTFKSLVSGTTHSRDKHVLFSRFPSFKFPPTSFLPTIFPATGILFRHINLDSQAKKSPADKAWQNSRSSSNPLDPHSAKPVPSRRSPDARKCIVPHGTDSGGGSGSAPPCGACKFLRRKCASGCIFAPYFGSDQGAARFAAVHKVFGASNVSKLLLHIPANRRQDAVLTISYEAQARLSDPVYGCVATILALQQQVAALQAELSVVQTQLINSRLAVANALQIPHQQHHVGLLQPAFSNNSSASNNLVTMGNYTGHFDPTDAAPSSRSFEPLQLSHPSNDEDDDEEESQKPIVFANPILHPK
ncbi:LOB domain-containing protein 20 [Nymphaea thermarum]|nr:LOB domain-containing protein 20 [Nymphaea thermarum]